MRYFRIMFIVSLMIALSSCSLKTLSSEATKQEQEQVKQKILSLLEKEYNQSFKMLKFNYEYKYHYDISFLFIVGKRYGVYNIEIKSENNPAVVIKLKLEDSFDEKNSALVFFKERRLKNVYCSSFGNYWKIHKNDKNNKQLEKNIKYCDSIGQKGQYNNPYTR